MLTADKNRTVSEFEIKIATNKPFLYKNNLFVFDISPNRIFILVLKNKTNEERYKIKDNKLNS